MKKYTQFNYNILVKLVVVILIIQMFLVSLLILQNFMFYKANFQNNVNQSITQTINIDNSNKEKTEKININNCSFEALDSLSGIGEIKANKIINQRPYNDIYEIKKVVGDTTFNKIKEHITI